MVLEDLRVFLWVHSRCACINELEATWLKVSPSCATNFETSYSMLVLGLKILLILGWSSILIFFGDFVGDSLTQTWVGSCWDSFILSLNSALSWPASRWISLCFLAEFLSMARTIVGPGRQRRFVYKISIILFFASQPLVCAEHVSGNYFGFRHFLSSFFGSILPVIYR